MLPPAALQPGKDNSAFDELVATYKGLQSPSVQLGDQSVPLFELEISDGWLEPESEALFWREARGREVFQLETAMASAKLRKLLEQNRYLHGTRFSKWPSRDRHQLWATLWLSMRFVLGRAYSRAELECVLAAHLACPDPSLVAAVRADLLRRDLLKEVGGEGDGEGEGGDGEGEGAGPVSGGEGEARYELSRPCLEFVLDGDKLFCIRTAVPTRQRHTTSHPE